MPMASVLARIRGLPRRVLVFAVAVVAVFVILVAVLASPRDLLGLLELTLYITGILGLSAAVTFAVIKLSPVQKKPKNPEPS